MKLGLGLGTHLAGSLAGSVFGGLDEDAAAYIAAVQAAGATVTETQRLAINTFFATGKTSGWYSSLKRLYLPIWGAASPNAIDLITRASGTFVGGVTHDAGYVRGNGTNGYFNTGTSLTSIGLSSGSGFFGLLVEKKDSVNGNAALMGYTTTTNSALIRHSSLTIIQSRFTSTNTALVGGNAMDGILSMSATSDASRSFRRRTSSGATSLATSSGEAPFTLLNSSIFVLCRNTAGSPSDFSTAEVGAVFIGLGLSDSATDDFTLALKTLWETCTGLTLP